MKHDDKIVWYASAALLACVLGWKLYSASIESAVYRRQGVEISTWEVLCGAKPVERAMFERSAK